MTILKPGKNKMGDADRLGSSSEIPRVESEAEQVMNEHVTAEALVKEDGRGDSGSGLSSGSPSCIIQTSEALMNQDKIKIS